MVPEDRKADPCSFNSSGNDSFAVSMAPAVTTCESEGVGIVSMFLFFLFFLPGVAAPLAPVEATSMTVGDDNRNTSVDWIVPITCDENFTTSDSVSARVAVQLGEDPRYLARTSRHINAD